MTTIGAAVRTPAERAAYGKRVRAEVPRSSHGRFEPDGERPDPVGILESQSAARVPELVPIRYSRMLESPFRFYRGAAAIMAADLGVLPHTGMTVQLCGDAHMLNFRLLASPERHLVFDINDFDETFPGPWEWDVKRLAASLAIVSRANGFSGRQCAAAVRACVRATGSGCASSPACAHSTSGTRRTAPTTWARSGRTGWAAAPAGGSRRPPTGPARARICRPSRS